MSIALNELSIAICNGFLHLVVWSKVVKICGRGQDVFSSVSEVASAYVTGEKRILGANRGKPFLRRQWR